jgi:RNA 3'-terminal phosphate cyclase (ATP)
MTGNIIHIDGSFGEGGGQILRTSLTLSAVTGQPFRIENIRKNRSRPGLMSQHLTCVNAAATVCNAEVSEVRKGSTELLFQPGLIRSGRFGFDVKTSGSAFLVFQTLFPILSFASGESELDLFGGTHNPKAPPFEYMERVYLPAVADLGLKGSVSLVRHGFFPRGGGIVRSSIFPRREGGILRMLERGSLKEMRPVVLIADLDREIAMREARVLGRELKRSSLPAEIRKTPSGEGPGNAILLEARYSQARCLFSAFGRKGRRAETVAREAVEAWQAFHRLEVPVQSELADQLLLPMALAGTASFVTGPLTNHARTNLHVIEAFLPERITVKKESSGRIRVEKKKT